VWHRSCPHSMIPYSLWGVAGLEGRELVSDGIIMKLIYSDKVSISECIAQTETTDAVGRLKG
jgi:hypothetical protein